MPWTARDAQKKTRKANTPKKRRMWAKVANQMLRSGKPEDRAIRAANAVVKRQKSRTKSRRSSSR